MKNDIIKFLCVSGIPYRVAPNKVYLTIDDKSAFEDKYERLTRDVARHDSYKEFIRRCNGLGILKWEDIKSYCSIHL